MVTGAEVQHSRQEDELRCALPPADVAAGWPIGEAVAQFADGRIGMAELVRIIDGIGEQLERQLARQACELADALAVTLASAKWLASFPHADPVWEIEPLEAPGLERLRRIASATR